MNKQILTTAILIASSATALNAALDSGTVLVDIVAGYAASYSNGSGNWNTLGISTGAATAAKTINVNSSGTTSGYTTSTGTLVSDFSVALGATNVPIWNAGGNATTITSFNGYDISTATSNKGVSINNTNTLTFVISGLTAGKTYDLSLGGNGYAGSSNTTNKPTTLALTTSGAYSGESTCTTATNGGAFTSTGATSVFDSQQTGAYALTWGNVEADTAGQLTFTVSAINTASGSIAQISWLAVSAIPEPSMFGLLAGLGALALAGARRRRK